MTDAQVTRLTVSCQKGCLQWHRDGTGVAREGQLVMTYAGTEQSWRTYHVFLCLGCGCKRFFYLADKQRLEEYVE